MRAVQITRFGGPEVLDVVDLPDPVPGEGQQLYEVSSSGVNYADTHQIENSYLAAQQLPLVPGAEFVGTPAGGGPRVVGLLDGGGYAEKVAAHPRLTWQVPDGVTDEQALAVVLQGSTAWHLLRTSAHLAAGETVVVIAGAGGVGSLAVQLARRWGAGRVIATASSPEKRALTEELGADTAVVPPGMLLQKSRAVVGFWLAHCMARPAMLDDAKAELLPLVADGALRPVVGGRYPLSAVREAHQDLLARRTTGKLVLDPSR